MSLGDWADGVAGGVTMIKVAVLCEKCDNVTVMQIDISDYGEPVCPRCGQYGVYNDSSGAKGLKVCLEAKCNRFMKVQYGSSCEGTRNSKECGKPIGPLGDSVDHLSTTAFASDDDDKEPKIVRQLKAAIKNAQSYVDSSGSHHKSTGGRHSSGDVEKHSGAHKAKAQDRQKHMKAIQDILEEDAEDEIPKKLAEEARNMIESVRNK